MTDPQGTNEADVIGADATAAGIIAGEPQDGLAVTAEQVADISAALPPEVASRIVYVPRPGADHGVLVVPPELDDAVEVAMRAAEDGTAALARRRAAARAECARRITERANANTQNNMNAWANVMGRKTTLTAADKAALAAYDAGVEWVQSMRARWPQIAEQDLDPADDANWPQPPVAAVALAARF